MQSSSSSTSQLSSEAGLYMYKNDDVKELMPATEEMYDNQDKRFKTCNDYTVPPLIVTRSDPGAFAA
jgi:hypothetical protein